MFSAATNRSKVTAQLSEICRLYLCTKTMSLLLYNSTEVLCKKKIPKFHQHSSLPLLVKFSFI